MDAQFGDPSEPNDAPDVDVTAATEEQPKHALSGYWAASEGEELASAIERKEHECHEVVRWRGLSNLWRISAAEMFHGDPTTPGVFDTVTIGMDGAHGEQLRFRISEPLSYLRQLVTMATGQKAAFQAAALDTDTATLAMAPVLDAAVEHFYRDQMPDSKERDLVFSAGGYGAVYVCWSWDKFEGEDVQLGTQQQPVPGQPPDVTAPVPVYGPSGAPVAELVFAWDEFHEPRHRGKHLWRGRRQRRSKYELMALFPQFAQQLQGMRGELSLIEQEMFGYRVYASEEELVLRHFYHVPIGDPNDPSNPLRAGRYVVTCGSLILHDDRLPVSRKSGLPIIEMMPYRLHDVSFGCAYLWGLIAAQQGKDATVSDVLSNLQRFGNANMFMDEETEVDFDQLASGGGVFIKAMNAAAPGFMQPPQMPQSASWLVEYCDGKQESISGLNATQRGNPPANVSSGEMAALFTNLAVERTADFPGALDEVRKASANIIADLILLNAENELLVGMTGAEDRTYITSFRPELLKGVRKYEMQEAPPLMRSVAGRMQMWQTIEQVPPKDRAGVIELVTTGQWRQLTGPDNAKSIRIRWENEQLSKGMAFQEPPPAPPPMPGMPPTEQPDPMDFKVQQLEQVLGVRVSVTDDPTEDLPQHVALYNRLMVNPQANKQAIDAVLVHIHDHVSKGYRNDPLLCAWLGIPPPPQPPAPPPPQTGAMPNGGAQHGEQPMPNGQGGPPPDRLGPKQPEPAKPPPGANIQ